MSARRAMVKPAPHGDFGTHSYGWCSGRSAASGKPMTHTLDFWQPGVASHTFMSRIDAHSAGFGLLLGQAVTSSAAAKPTARIPMRLYERVPFVAGPGVRSRARV